MNARKTKFGVISSPTDPKKLLTDLKENLVQRQIYSSQAKPSSSQQGLGQGLTQQPMSAQAVRQLPIKNSDAHFGAFPLAKPTNQENQGGFQTGMQGLMAITKSGKMMKSQSLSKNGRFQMPMANTNMKSIRNLQAPLRSSDLKENIDNDKQNTQTKTNFLSINNHNKNEIDNEKKQQIANIKLPKLQPPSTGQGKDKNGRIYQKVNNFIDNHMTDQEQMDDKQGGAKKKDQQQQSLRDNQKFFKNSNPSTPLQDSNNGMITKKDDELSKIYGGGLKHLKQNISTQNAGVTGMKQAVSTLSLSMPSGAINQPAQYLNSGAAFTTKHPPKKSAIQMLQQKQLRMFEKNNSINNSMPASKQSNSLNSSRVNELEEPPRKEGYIQSYAYKSKAGCNFQGPKKNQDNFIIHPNLNKLPNRYLFSVCDGHGVLGHEVSGFIRQHYPKILENLLSKDLYCLDSEYISSCLKLSYLQLSQKLLESKIDCTFSGSTFVSVLIIDDKIWCANTGDSRGIICKQQKALWNAEYLSMDHKADLPEERKRIEASGGRVDSYRDFNGEPIGPARVWMKYDDIPGLAMSRSFGDLIAAQCGVTCEPDDDKFIVIASDGVWEFLNNRQVMILAMPFFIRMQPDMACQKIVSESYACWKQHDEVVDDITAISVFFHKNKPKKSNQELHEQNDQEQLIQENFNNNPIQSATLKQSQEEYGLEEKISEEISEANENNHTGLNKLVIRSDEKQDDQKKNNPNQKSSSLKQNFQKKEEIDRDIKQSKEEGTNTNHDSNNQKKVENNKQEKVTIQKTESGKQKGRYEDHAKRSKQKEGSDSESEYSKDFELDRERENQQEKISKDQTKAPKEKKETSKSKHKQNLEEDGGQNDYQL